MKTFHFERLMKRGGKRFWNLLIGALHTGIPLSFLITFEGFIDLLSRAERRSSQINSDKRRRKIIGYWITSGKLPPRCPSAPKPVKLFSLIFTGEEEKKRMKKERRQLQSHTNTCSHTAEPISRGLLKLRKQTVSNSRKLPSASAKFLLMLRHHVGCHASVSLFHSESSRWIEEEDSSFDFDLFELHSSTESTLTLNMKSVIFHAPGKKSTFTRFKTEGVSRGMLWRIILVEAPSSSYDWHNCNVRNVRAAQTIPQQKYNDTLYFNSSCLKVNGLTRLLLLCITRFRASETEKIGNAAKSSEALFQSRYFENDGNLSIGSFRSRRSLRWFARLLSCDPTSGRKPLASGFQHRMQHGQSITSVSDLVVFANSCWGVKLCILTMIQLFTCVRRRASIQANWVKVRICSLKCVFTNWGTTLLLILSVFVSLHQCP